MDLNLTRSPSSTKNSDFIDLMLDTLKGTALFVLITVVTYLIVPAKLRDATLEAISLENLSINTFLITFFLSLAGVCIAFFAVGPLKESYLISCSRCEPKQNEHSWNARFYRYLFQYINEFNISVGVGSLGVIFGLTVLSLVQGQYGDFKQGLGAACILLFFVCSSIALGYFLPKISELLIQEKKEHLQKRNNKKAGASGEFSKLFDVVPRVFALVCGIFLLNGSYDNLITVLEKKVNANEPIAQNQEPIPSSKVN